MKSKQASAPIEYVFLAQCLDHGLSMMVAAIIGFGALEVLELSNPTTWRILGMGFWVGALLVLWVSSFLYRAFFIVFWGETLGRSLLGIRAQAGSPKSKAFWFRHFLECVQLALPILWALEIGLRFLGARGPYLDYQFDYT
jgi:hypothetical protein